MIKSKIMTAFAVFGLAALLLFAGCNNANVGGNNNNSGNNNSGKSGSSNTVELDGDECAFNIFRSLCEIQMESTDDIEELPDNWKSMQFTADIGKKEKGSDTVRLVTVKNVNEAVEYVSSFVGEDVEAEDKNWTITGLGSLSFKIVTGDVDLFATLDVNISQITNLTQIKFVSGEYLAAQGADNSYSGQPYYHAGDVIQKVKDGTIWMCVRPAGGPLEKDKSYWMCLHPFNNKGECIIKGETKSVKMYYEEKVDKNNKQIPLNTTYTFAKNLMEYRIAKAAYHTVALLNIGMNDNSADSSAVPKKTAQALKNKGFNFDGLHVSAYEVDGSKHTDTYQPGAFLFAYGSSKTDPNRKMSRKGTASGKVADCATVQCMFGGDIELKNDGKIEESILTIYARDNLRSEYQITKMINGEKQWVGVNFLLSPTDTFDETFFNSAIGSIQCPYGGVTMDFGYMVGATDNEANDPFDESKWKYDYKNFLHQYKNNKLQYVLPTKYYAVFLPPNPARHVIFSPQLMIKDNKGKANEAKRPVTDREYTDIFVARRDVSSENDWFDYWDSIDKTTRLVNNKEVNWKNETDYNK